MSTEGTLAGRIALVAGATRGAGRAMAIQLGAAGATVYVTGRTTRDQVSEVGRATETIEETAELVTAAGEEAARRASAEGGGGRRAGGTGIAVPTDHLDRDAVRALTARIDREQGRLNILVNSLWGGDHLIDFPGDFGRRMWDFDLDKGLRMLRLGIESHAVTSYYALPLLVREPGGLVVEVTDGTAEYLRDYRGQFFFDLAKFAPIRMTLGLAEELRDLDGTAVCLTPGFLRSETMLDTYFQVTEENWRDAIGQNATFAVSETPTYVGRAVAALAADPDRARWNGQSVSSGRLARVYGFTDVDGTRPDAWGYIAAGRGADADAYR